MGVVRLRSSIAFSLMLHFCLFLAWVVFIGYRAAQVNPQQFTYIDLEPVSVPPRLHKQEPDSHRIVQTTKGTKVDEAAPNAFLGEHTQIVDRQTVSAKQVVALGQERENKKAQERQRQREKAPSLTPTGALSKFGVPIFPKAVTKQTPEEAFQDRPWAMAESVPQDYVKGLKQSDRTALNTREYIFYGYFQRIRQRLDLAWNGVLRDHLTRLYRGGRKLASDMDHTTRLLVTLNKSGEIVRVQVLEASGTMDLDDAAIKAFNRAGPFPNPPKGIVDRNGSIQIRWDFVLKT